MNVDYRLIGTRIKQKRKEKGYTQEYFAEKLNVTVGYVSQVERGITKISLNLLAAIADIIECNIAELISESSISSSRYLNNDVMKNFEQLSASDKQLVSDFILLLLKR